MAWTHSLSPLILLLTRLTLFVRAQDVVTFPTNIEVDVIFPRNDTYSHADPFPFVFAIQGATAAWNFGFKFEWTLKYADGYASGLVDSGGVGVLDLDKPGAAQADPYILANRSIVLSPVFGDHSYTLEWGFHFYSNCTDNGGTFDIGSVAFSARGSLIFSVKGGGKTPDIAASGTCPVFGSLIGLQANLTGCPHVGDTGKKENPCAVTVDAALASSITAQATLSNTAKTASSTVGTLTSAGPGSTAAGNVGGSSPGGNSGARTHASLAAVVGAAVLISSLAWM